MRRESFNSENGAILLIVIILMLALTITGLAFLNAGVMENSLVRREIHKNQAFYLAEAGVEATIWELNYGDSPLSGPGWYKDAEGYHSPTDNLQDPQGNSAGDYKVTVEEDEEGNIWAIESTGYVPSEAEKKVEKTVRVTLQKILHPIFDYAIASGEWIKLENVDTEVSGNVYATGDIIVEAATIDGDARTTGGSIYNQGTVTGGERDNWPLEDFPEFDGDYYLREANLIGQVIGEGDLEDGVYKIEGADPYKIPKILYVEGNVKISNSSSLEGPGSIVAKGTILVEEGSQVGTSKDTAVSLISAHPSAGEEDPAIKIEDSSIIWGVLWAPNGEIKIEDSTVLHGSSVSGDEHKIEVGSGVIYIHEEIPDGSLPSVYSVQWWEEV